MHGWAENNLPSIARNAISLYTASTTAANDDDDKKKPSPIWDVACVFHVRTSIENHFEQIIFVKLTKKNRPLNVQRKQTEIVLWEVCQVARIHTPSHTHTRSHMHRGSGTIHTCTVRHKTTQPTTKQ